jgi:hypothetical protein
MTEKNEATTTAEQKYEALMASLSELEEAAVIMTELFDKGVVKSERYGDLTMERSSQVATCLTALYSTATMLWGEARGTVQKAELIRKYYDSSKYAKIKQKYTEEGTKATQKDIESLVAINNKDFIKDEIKWNELYARLGAIRDVFETQLRTVDMIWKMRRVEMGIGQY